MPKQRFYHRWLISLAEWIFRNVDFYQGATYTVTPGRFKRTIPASTRKSRALYAFSDSARHQDLTVQLCCTRLEQEYNHRKAMT